MVSPQTVFTYTILLNLLREMLQVRRPSTQPEFSSNVHQQRRMSVRRNSTLPVQGPIHAFGATPARRASMAPTKPTKPKDKEPEPALTTEQKEGMVVMVAMTTMGVGVSPL